MATVATIPLLGNLHKAVTTEASKDGEKFLAEMGLDYGALKVPALVGDGFSRSNTEQVSNQFHILRDTASMNCNDLCRMSTERWLVRSSLFPR